MNLLFLFPVGLIPFGASVLGHYPSDPIALQLYGIIMVFATIMRLVLYAYVARRPALLQSGHVPERMRSGLTVAGAPILIYLLAMAVAGVSTTAGLILYFSVPILSFLLVTVPRDRRHSPSQADTFT